jgi:hypothetical protein
MRKAPAVPEPSTTPLRPPADVNSHTCADAEAGGSRAGAVEELRLAAQVAERAASHAAAASRSAAAPAAFATLVVGRRFQAACGPCSLGESLSIRHEPNNPRDRNALIVVTAHQQAGARRLHLDQITAQASTRIKSDWAGRTPIE